MGDIVYTPGPGGGGSGGTPGDDTVTSAKIVDGTIVAADIATGAVTSAKILDGTIVDGDINATAAIAQSKLGATTGDVVKASGSGVTAIQPSVVTSAMIVDGTIVNADVAAAAALAHSKLADFAAAGVIGATAAGTSVDLTVAQLVTMLGGQIGGLPIWGRLAADQLLTLSDATNFQTVTGLLVAIGASATEVWWFESYGAWTDAAGTDIDFHFSFPASCTMLWGELGGSPSTVPGFGMGTTASTPTALKTESTTYAMGTAAVTGGWAFGGFIFGGGSAGNVQLTARETTSDANQRTLKKHSFIRAFKLAA